MRARILLVLFVSFILSGCGGEAERRTPIASGEWVAFEFLGGWSRSTLSVDPGGSFTGSFHFPGAREAKVRGSWTQVLVETGADVSDAIEFTFEEVAGEKLPPDAVTKINFTLYPAPAGMDILMYAGTMAFTRPGNEKAAAEWMKNEVEKLAEGG